MIPIIRKMTPIICKLTRIIPKMRRALCLARKTKQELNQSQAQKFLFSCIQGENLLLFN